MTLPGSGTISINSLVGEFGGSAPHALSEYYRNGGLVSSGNTNVPTSGALSLSDFYGATATTTRDIRVQMSYNAGHGYSAFGVTSANSTAAPQSYSGSLLYNPFTIYSPVFRAGTGFLGQNINMSFSQNEDAQGCSIYLYGGTSSTAVNTVVLGLNAGYSSGQGGARGFSIVFDSNGGCTSITNTSNTYNYSLISISTNNPSTSHRWYQWRCISPNATQKASTMMNGDPTSLSSVTQPA
jgi:hypothetical protein